MMKRRIAWILAAMFVIGVALSGCGQKGEPGSSEAGATASGPASSGTLPMANPMGGGGKMMAGLTPNMQDHDESSAGAKAPKVDLTAMADAMPDRFLIRNATLTLEAKDVRQAADALTAEARAAKGYVSDTHESVDALGSRSITMTVRVPADRFDGSMQKIESMGKVMEKQVTSDDVTEEFVDSQSRLRNLRHTEDRLLEHLTKTGRLADTLLVEKELARVRLEIEQLEGRIRFLSHRIAFSTITATVKETAHSQTLVPPETFSSGKIASDASRSLVGFSQSAWSVAIWMGIWAVVWAPILVCAWWFYRRSQTAKTAV